MDNLELLEIKNLDVYCKFVRSLVAPSVLYLILYVAYLILFILFDIVYLVLLAGRIFPYDH